MSAIRPFDVVIIPFPYSDRISQAKRRPAVVISKDPVFHQKTGTMTVAMITSSATAWPHDAPLKQRKQAGLDMPCAIRMKLFTLEQAHTIRRVGSLGKTDRKALAKSLQAALVT